MSAPAMKRPWQVRDFMANPLESHIVCDAVEVRKYILDLEDALAGAAVISNIAGSRIKELEALTTLPLPVSVPGQSDEDVARQIGQVQGVTYMSLSNDGEPCAVIDRVATILARHRQQNATPGGEVLLKHIRSFDGMLAWMEDKEADYTAE